MGFAVSLTLPAGSVKIKMERSVCMYSPGGGYDISDSLNLWPGQSEPDTVHLFVSVNADDYRNTFLFMNELAVIVQSILSL